MILNNARLDLFCMNVMIISSAIDSAAATCSSDFSDLQSHGHEGRECHGGHGGDGTMCQAHGTYSNIMWKRPGVLRTPFVVIL